MLNFLNGSEQKREEEDAEEYQRAFEDPSRSKKHIEEGKSQFSVVQVSLTAFPPMLSPGNWKKVFDDDSAVISGEFYRSPGDIHFLCSRNF